MKHQYIVGQIVVVRPYDGAYCEVPALVLRLDGEYRLDVQFAHGNEDNVGCGNVRQAEQWQSDSFYRMRDESRTRANHLRGTRY